MQNNSSHGSVVEPASAQPFAPPAPGSAIPQSALKPVGTGTPVGAKSHGHMIETIILVIVSLVAVTFIGLFIWKYIEWDDARTDVEGQVSAAVAVAVSENTTKLENEFLEREKYPYKSFAGPADYGSLSFEYPKTWNIYVAKDAANGGNYEAYLNPGEVLPISNTSINALRVVIYDTAFDKVTKNYDSSIKKGTLTLATLNVGSAIANVYTGELPSKLQGIVAVFKLRDKTVLLQTDAMLFRDDFYKLLDTVSFIE